MVMWILTLPYHAAEKKVEAFLWFIVCFNLSDSSIEGGTSEVGGTVLGG